MPTGRDAAGDHDAQLAPFTTDAENAAIITDFDGTLAPIVRDPAAARPLPGAVDLLHRLAATYGTVAVVSGRPAAFLIAALELDRRPGSRLVAHGLYGLETATAHGVTTSVEAEAWRGDVEAVAALADAEAPNDVIVERKGLSVTIHVRTAPDEESWAASWARIQAAARGLAVHPGRMSYELRPPVDVDKGTVVTALTANARAACFVGDDLGDLPAFDALARLTATTGMATLRVVVRSPEAPAALLERADLVVDGPPGALDFLRRLAPPDAQS